MASPVACMNYSGPRGAAIKAILARAAFSEQYGIGTKQTVIAESLNHCHLFLLCRVVDRGGNEREEILRVNDIKMRLAKPLENFFIYLLRPDCA